MAATAGSDHCPAMKGIETRVQLRQELGFAGSDHCPAMKGIETILVFETLGPLR